MRITVTACLPTAIHYGRNATEWTTEIDVAALTEDQRFAMRRHINSNGLDISRYNAGAEILSTTGDITPESLNAAITAQAIKRAEAEKQAAKEAAEMDAKILKWLALPDDQKITHKWSDYSTDEPNRQGCDAYDPRVKTEVARLQAICDERDAKRAAETAANKQAEETKKQVEEAALVEQLRAAVQILGTSDDYERWISGLMPRSEAIKMVWDNELKPAILADFTPLASNEYCLAEHISDYSETEKKTLNREQYSTVKKIKSALPGWAAEYYIQTGTDDNNGEQVQVVICRMTRKCGQLNLSADFIL